MTRCRPAPAFLQSAAVMTAGELVRRTKMVAGTPELVAFALLPSRRRNPAPGLPPAAGAGAPLPQPLRGLAGIEPRHGYDGDPPSLVRQRRAAGGHGCAPADAAQPPPLPAGEARH